MSSESRPSKKSKTTTSSTSSSSSTSDDFDVPEQLDDLLVEYLRLVDEDKAFKEQWKTRQDRLDRVSTRLTEQMQTDELDELEVEQVGVMRLTVTERTSVLTTAARDERIHSFFASDQFDPQLTGAVLATRLIDHLSQGRGKTSSQRLVWVPADKVKKNTK